MYSHIKAPRPKGRAADTRRATVMHYATEEQRRGTLKILEFVRILKDADVRVSPVEVIDVFGALGHVDFTSRAVFKQALSTTLIKDYTDIPIFERCFGEFFDRRPADEADASLAVFRGAQADGAEGEGLPSGDELREAGDAIDAYIDGLPDETLATLSARDIVNLILDDESLASSSGALGMMVMNARSRRGRSESDADEEGDDAALTFIIGRVRRRLRERNIGRSIRAREEYLLNKYIYQLKPAEVQEMRELVRRFGQKLKNRISLRKKRVKHGGLDVKRTLRSNLAHGGIPFRLYYRDKKIDRPQLVVLCDISSSVNQYSRFMLLLTYTLQGLFSKVRTFAFISNMVEITPLFMEMDPERALNSIFTDTSFTYGFGSNYGRCFNQFIDDYSDSLGRKTTVLVLGDARNNNQDPGMNSFIRIKESSRNIFWLNPDRRHLWDWSDSIAGLYAAHCTEMKEVNNFLDLSEFIDRLFK